VDLGEEQMPREMIGEYLNPDPIFAETKHIFNLLDIL